MNNRHNCFDVIRLIASLAVLFSHQYPISGRPEPSFFGLTSIGGVAVIAFFAISGYLITASWMSCKSTLSYVNKRIRRLFPGLFVCSVIMVYFAAPVFGVYNQKAYVMSWSSIEALYSYALIQYQIPFTNGFTSGYHLPNSVNGSLWTLKFEFLDYILIAAVLFLKKKPLACAIGLLLVSLVAYTVCVFTFDKNPSAYNIHDLEYYIYRGSMLTVSFTIGSVFYFTRNTIATSYLSWVVSLALIVISVVFDLFQAFMIGFSVLILLVGVTFNEKLIAGKFDYSYGIYIYAFPVQQIVVNELHYDFYGSMAISALITIFFAAASWHLVERKFLPYRVVQNHRSAIPATPTNFGDHKTAFEKAQI